MKGLFVNEEEETFVIALMKMGKNCCGKTNVSFISKQPEQVFLFNETWSEDCREFFFDRIMKEVVGKTRKW